MDQDFQHGDYLSAHDTPAAYRDSFVNLDDAKVDPVSQHCKHSHRPLVWDRSTYVHAGQGAAWEHQAQYGWLPHRHCGGAPSAERSPLEPTMRLLARPELEQHKGLALSSGELEVLRWTMEGKTAWEIGRILGIAENTGDRARTQRVTQLGCTSKHHAVVKALRLGLIQ